ncbi:MAG TPA: TetR/AcrR family transcriptional regulator [Woeseiaceae bacterium]|nr:TetR/AcrR family transcriptional regulator [Woeseiaceae bacterium]
MSTEPTEKKPPAKARRPSARERICETARDLFYSRGIRGVGVEMIAAEAGTTKMSLYRNFASKDELVAECLCRQEQEFWRWWDATVGPFEGQPKRQIELLFEALEAKVGSEQWSRGCQFSNAAVELPDAEHPARKIILKHHREVRERLRRMCREMGAREPDALADGLLLLMRGVYLSCLVFGKNETPQPISQNVRALLHSELGAAPD